MMFRRKDWLARAIERTAPPGSTVTLQLDGSGGVIAWWVRQPHDSARSLFPGNNGRRPGEARPR